MKALLSMAILISLAYAETKALMRCTRSAGVAPAEGKTAASVTILGAASGAG
jgi:hypothetical protein